MGRKEEEDFRRISGGLKKVLLILGAPKDDLLFTTPPTSVIGAEDRLGTVLIYAQEIATNNKFRDSERAQYLNALQQLEEEKQARINAEENMMYMQRNYEQQQTLLLNRIGQLTKK